jgi:hypothetical protein
MSQPYIQYIKASIYNEMFFLWAEQAITGQACHNLATVVKQL